jgi:hypothetical protein
MAIKLLSQNNGMRFAVMCFPKIYVIAFWVMAPCWSGLQLLTFDPPTKLHRVISEKIDVIGNWLSSFFQAIKCYYTYS